MNKILLFGLILLGCGMSFAGIGAIALTTENENKWLFILSIICSIAGALMTIFGLSKTIRHKV